MCVCVCVLNVWPNSKHTISNWRQLRKINFSRKRNVTNSKKDGGGRRLSKINDATKIETMEQVNWTSIQWANSLYIVFNTGNLIKLTERTVQQC